MMDCMCMMKAPCDVWTTTSHNGPARRHPDTHCFAGGAENGAPLKLCLFGSLLLDQQLSSFQPPAPHAMHARSLLSGYSMDEGSTRYQALLLRWRLDALCHSPRLCLCLLCL